MTHLTDPKGNPERGKSQPGFLPLGPWMVAAKELPLWSAGRALRIQTEVRGATGVRCAQQALTSDMQLAPSALLQELSRYLIHVDSIGREPVRLEGALRRFSLARRGPRGFDLPAGSVVLTGTPPGTAFGATPKPAAPKKGFLGFGSSSGKGAADVLAERHVYGYLSAGDEVSISIQNLGRQELEVR
jgi:2-keto-4-pentenoate hydratase/2-oxohepta-3-ene-1,7-dioic acid hydratase in catechol pathway